MIRKETETEYDVRDGYIVSPGKFEGCRAWAPRFYKIVMTGGCKRIEDWDLGHIDIIPIEKEDIDMFPELSGYQEVMMAEDEQGLVYADLK